MIAVANEFTGQTALFALLFSWPILYAFYFFDRRAALAHVALAALAYAILLVLAEPPSPYVRWLLVIGTPTAAGLLIWTLLDRVLAERVAARERELLLSQNEARTRIVLDSAPDAFVAIDRDGVIRTWNAAAERMLGWSASEAVGKPLRALDHPARTARGLRRAPSHAARSGGARCHRSSGAGAPESRRPPISGGGAGIAGDHSG